MAGLMFGALMCGRAASEPLSLRDLAMEYRRDTAAADVRFKGKRIDIVGQIESVGTDYLGMKVENVARIRAGLDRLGQQDARSLRPGATISMSCVIDGTGYYMVEMTQCHSITLARSALPLQASQARPQQPHANAQSRHPLREYHNTPDMECDLGRQCTNGEFSQLLADQRSKWDITPDWIQARCMAEPTLPRLEKCIIENTLIWLNRNPSTSASWLPGT